MFNPMRPWRNPIRLLRTLGYVLTAMPIAAFTFATVITLLALSAGLLITFVLALPFIWLLFAWSRMMGRVERARIDALMGVRIPDPIPPLQATGAFVGCGRSSRPVPAGRRSATTSPPSRSAPSASLCPMPRGAVRSRWCCCRRT